MFFATAQSVADPLLIPSLTISEQGFFRRLFSVADPPLMAFSDGFLMEMSVADTYVSVLMVMMVIDACNHC